MQLSRLDPEIDDLIIIHRLDENTLPYSCFKSKSSIIQCFIIFFLIPFQMSRNPEYHQVFIHWILLGNFDVITMLSVQPIRLIIEITFILSSTSMCIEENNTDIILCDMKESRREEIPIEKWFNINPYSTNGRANFFVTRWSYNRSLL